MTTKQAKAILDKNKVSKKEFNKAKAQGRITAY